MLYYPQISNFQYLGMQFVSIARKGRNLNIKNEQDNHADYGQSQVKCCSKNPKGCRFANNGTAPFKQPVDPVLARLGNVNTSAPRTPCRKGHVAYIWCFAVKPKL